MDTRSRDVPSFFLAPAVLGRREELICDVNKGIEQLEAGESTLLDIAKIQAAVESRLEKVLKKQ
jgi:hypothetical protein